MELTVKLDPGHEMVTELTDDALEMLFRVWVATDEIVPDTTLQSTVPLSEGNYL